MEIGEAVGRYEQAAALLPARWQQAARRAPEHRKALAEEFRRVGANPILVPAMGSHGGALAENQRAILTHYGITEASAVFYRVCDDYP